MNNSCTRLKEFMKIQLEIVERHLNDHKYYQQIENENEGVRDFIDKFAWLIRETHCLYHCEDRDVCQISKDLIKKYEKKD